MSQDAGWVRDAVFYEVFPERFANGDRGNDPPGTVAWGSRPTRKNFFGGDLRGIIDKLPYLEELGVTALYLTPVFKAPSNHKYDTEDYLQVDPGFGDTQTLKELVKSAHARGIRIILDGVFNHCGDTFWAFRDLQRKRARSPYVSWFYPASLPVRKRPPNYRVCSEAPSLPKLRVENPEVRRYLLEVATKWTGEAGIDGWRLDVPWKVAPDFWPEFRRTVKSINPEAYIVGEVWRDAAAWVRQPLFDGAMNYRLRDLILGYVVYDALDAEDFGFELEELSRSLGDAAFYMLNLLGSHDTPRLLTLCRGSRERAMAALTLLFALPGAPMVYYGDEVGMRGGNDPDCRGSMVWNPEEQDGKMREHYRRLIAIRTGNRALSQGTFRTHWVFNSLFAFRREIEESMVIVVVNPRQPRRGVRIPMGDAATHGGRWVDLLGEGRYEVQDSYLLIEHFPAPAALLLVPETSPASRGEEL